MTCPLCGDVCRCVSDTRQIAFSRAHVNNGERSSVRVYAATAPEMTPASEAIAGSLKDEAESPRPRFVVERDDEDEEQWAADRSLRSAFHSGVELERESSSTRMPGTSEPIPGSANQLQPDLLAAPNDSWREEVSARLHHYRARRRPRAPRYPSLRLKFEAPESTWTPSCRASEAPVLMARPAVLAEELAKKIPVADPVPDLPAPEQVRQTPIPAPASESTAKIIEFPKWSYTPPVRYSDLAEPVIDRPRILEAPEIVPPPPALGGITIEEEHKQEPERRPGIDMPLQCARVEQRLLAVAIDAMLVLLAGGIFAAVYYQIAGARPAVPQMIGLGIGLLTSFWVAYQYLLIVYSASTPGLRAMKLQLQRFDGSVTTRTLRRWRVLGSMLSAISLGMGYAWQFLDEDALCWHERVTKTYLAPQSKAK